MGSVLMRSRRPSGTRRLVPAPGWAYLAVVALSLIGRVARADDTPTSEAPPAARAHALRGEEYFRLQRYPEAVAEFQAAIAVAPEWHEVYYDLGVAYDAEGHAAEALAALRQYLPFAHADEDAPLRQKIAQLEIAVSDQQHEKEEDSARRADAERARRIQARVRAESERRAQEERAKADARQILTIRCGMTCTGVRVVSENGQMTRACSPGKTCVLHVPPGHARVMWGESDRTDIDMPVGPATLTDGRGSNTHFAIKMAAAAGMLGGTALATLGAVKHSTPALIGGIALGAASAVVVFVDLAAAAPSFEPDHASSASASLGFVASPYGAAGSLRVAF